MSYRQETGGLRGGLDRAQERRRTAILRLATASDSREAWAVTQELAELEVEIRLLVFFERHVRQGRLRGFLRDKATEVLLEEVDDVWQGRGNDLMRLRRDEKHRVVEDILEYIAVTRKEIWK